MVFSSFVLSGTPWTNFELQFQFEYEFYLRKQSLVVSEILHDCILHIYPRGNMFSALTPAVPDIGVLSSSKLRLCQGTDNPAGKVIHPNPPQQPLKLGCELCAEYVPWKDNVPEIEVG